MPDRDGRACSSVVWMVPGPRAVRLAALDDAGLAGELAAETMGLAGPRAVWLIVWQVALRLAARHLALVAEAAHLMPPIGAQGLNTSLADIETLAQTIAEADGPCAPDIPARYERRALPATLARVAGVDLLNRAAQADAQPLRDLLRAGLAVIHRIAPLRRLAIGRNISCLRSTAPFHPSSSSRCSRTLTTRRIKIVS